MSEEDPRLAVLVSIPIGIGDLLIARAQLDQVAHRYSEISILFGGEYAPCRTVGYRDALADIARIVFAGAPYTVPGRYSKVCASAEGLYECFKVEPRWPQLAHLLCPDPPPRPPRPYLALHTKVRFYPSRDCAALWPRFVDLLRQLSGSFDLVLLGERRLEGHNEWAAHGPGLIYSNYQRYQESGLDLKDRTVDVFSGSPMDRIRQFRQDCTVLRGAAASLHVGIGGAFCLAASLTRTMCLHKHPGMYVDRFLSETAPPGSIYTPDWPSFRACALSLL